MAIRSFNDYEFYKPRFTGSEKGAFYKIKTHLVASSSLELFYIKSMTDESIVNEYIASNIAHLLLEDSAPVVELAVSYNGRSRTIHTVSKVLPVFKNLEQLSKQYALPQEYFLKGYIVDQHGKFQPRHLYSEWELETRKDLQIVPYLKKIEEVIVVAQYLNYLDMRSQNLGAIVYGTSMTAALVDFNKGLQYQSYKIEYDSDVTSDYQINTFVQTVYKTENLLNAISKLISKEQEIITLAETLSKDLLQLNLVHDSATLKTHLQEKLKVFKDEFIWLNTAKLWEESSRCSDNTELFIGLKDSNMALVSNMAIVRIIDLAVKNDIIVALVEQMPEITRYKDYTLVELTARIKYKPLVSFELSMLSTAAQNIARFLSVAIEHKKQDVIDYLASLPLVRKDLQVVFESAVKFGNKKTFDDLFVKFSEKIKSKSPMEQSGIIYKTLEKAFVESVISDRSEFFAFIYPYMINKYYAPPNCAHATENSVVIALTEAIKGNKNYFFTQLLPNCAQDTLTAVVTLIALYNRVELVEQANPHILQLLLSYGVTLDEDKVSLTVAYDEIDINTMLTAKLSHALVIDQV